MAPDFVTADGSGANDFIVRFFRPIPDVARLVAKVALLGFPKATSYFRWI
jgi:hypothetical protein